jgi:serine/threonine protein kinase
MDHVQSIKFGKYRLLNRIAVGGMAELFLAKMTSIQGFEKTVVIKRLLPQLLEDQELVSMFLNEARLAATFTHRNILQIYDLGEVDDTFFIAMEYIDGKNLRTILRRCKNQRLLLSIQNALYITSQICTGLDYIHNLKNRDGKALNLIHRDVSPENVMITTQGEVKIIDFGIAKATCEASMTRVGVLKGKLAYMSPEQASGERLDRCTDIFSTGILLYEMVTGKRVYGGADVEMLARIRNADFAPAEKLMASLSSDMRKILNRSLAKNPRDRYQNCAEFAADVNDCLAVFPTQPNSDSLAQSIKQLFNDDPTSTSDRVEENSLPVSSEASRLAERFPKFNFLSYPKKILTEKFRKAVRSAGQWLRYVKSKRVSFDKNSDQMIISLFDEIKQHPALLLRTLLKKAATLPRPILLGAFILLIVGPLLAYAISLNPKRNSYQEKAISSAVGTLEPGLNSSLQEVPSSSSDSVISYGSGNTRSERTTPSADPSIDQKIQLAVQKLGMGDYISALVLFEEILIRNPSIIERIANPYSKALLARGSEQMGTDPNEAISLIEKAVKIDPFNAKGHFQLGRIHTTLEHYPQAIEAYKKSAELDPGFPDVYFNIGYVYGVMGDYSEAETMFRICTELLPSYLDEVYLNLAIVQKKQGKEVESLRSLKRSLEANPENEAVRRYMQKLQEQQKDNDKRGKS